MIVCESEALIKARSSTVWDVITESGNLTVWESGIADIDGDLQDREAVSLRINRHGRTLRARIRQNPPEMMTWTAALPLRLFRAVRTFVLIPQAQPRTSTISWIRSGTAPNCSTGHQGSARPAPFPAPTAKASDEEPARCGRPS
jgi:hypothetical protein